MKIAFQGEHGAYSEQAIFEKFGKVETLPCKSFREIFESVESGSADLGMVPVQNSTAGSINETYDDMLEFNLPIIGEHFFKVEHCLIGCGPIDLVKSVYSHPQALAQCREFLNGKYEAVASRDTAGAVKELSEDRDPSRAAIAGRLAAELYGLTVLKDDIQTLDNNTTRFWIIAKESKGKEPVAYKTSIVFEVRDIPSALYKCLGGFATNHVNLTNLESRPSRSKQWSYLFYLDLEGHIQDESVQNAMDELKFFTSFVKVLGSYPKA